MPFREARRTMHSPAAVSAQHHGDRAQHIKKPSGEGLDLICAQRSQELPRQQRRRCQSVAGNLLVILTTLMAVLQLSL